MELSKKKDKTNRLEKKKIEFELKNVVATATFILDVKIDLLKILRDSPNAKYNPEKFPGVILKLEEPKSTFLIFSTGKIVITGLRDLEHLNVAVNFIVNKFTKLNIKFSNVNSKIENLVISGNFNESIKLNKAALDLENIMYEPEVFPGLIYYMKEPRVVFLIFSTGKFVGTGSRSINELEEGIYRMEKLLRNNNLFIEGENIIEEDISEFFI